MSSLIIHHEPAHLGFSRMVCSLKIHSKQIFLDVEIERQILIVVVRTIISRRAGLHVPVPVHVPYFTLALALARAANFPGQNSPPPRPRRPPCPQRMPRLAKLQIGFGICQRIYGGCVLADDISHNETWHATFEHRERQCVGFLIHSTVDLCT